MDEAFILACKKLVVVGGAVGFSVDDMLTLLLNGMTVDHLLDVIQATPDRNGRAVPDELDHVGHQVLTRHQFDGCPL
jgi:hypothetical protein